MVMAIASYYYITDPFYIQHILNGIDFATLQPEVDPEVFTTPYFVELVHTVMSFLVPLIIGAIIIFHTVAFYRSYLRKRAAIAYVKFYSFMAALSLVMWFVYNVSLKNSLIVIPAVIYAMVFKVERQPLATRPAIDNVLTNNNNV